MKDLNNYYSDTALIKMLCKHRAGISHKRHKKHMTRDISYHDRTNKISISDHDVDFNKIQALFPTRRNWKKLNQNERLHPTRFNNSLERNGMRLWKSYKVEKYLVDKRGKIPETWYSNLLGFCEDIRGIIDGLLVNDYSLKKPQIFPLPKSTKKGKFLYRPIAKYTLEDKIITSAFAKYLTETFDQIFKDCSFAFRARRAGVVPNHHDSIVEILKYRKKKRKLWVAECDIQKFFDTVQHLHLEKVFFEGINELKSKGVKVSFF